MTETAPEDATTVPVDDGRPHAPGVAGFVAVAAALAGTAALVLYGWSLAEGWQLLIALAMIVTGVVVARPAADPDVRRTWVLGRWVLTGIGVAGVVLGTYRAGIALVALSIPDRTSLFGAQPAMPPPVVILLLLYGVPLIALIILAVRGQATGLVGAGLIVPVLAVSILAVAGADVSVIAIVSLVVVVACVPVAVLSASAWGSFAILIGLMAASFAVGAGVSPFGTLTTSTSRPATRATEAEEAAGTLPDGLVPVVLVVALGAAAVLLALAVARRDVAGGLVGGALFSVPPAQLLISTLMTGEALHTSRSLALAAIPLVALVLGLAGWRASALRDAIARILRLPAAHPAGFAAAAGIAAVVLMVHSLAAFGLPSRVAGVITLVVLAAAILLAVRLPGTPGAVLAGVSLVGLQLGSPWLRVFNGDQGVSNGFLGWKIAAIVGLIAAMAVAVVLIIRHRQAGVWAAAAYLLAGSIAEVLWTLLGAERVMFGGAGEIEALLVLVLPLLLLGVPAAVAALRGSAAGQAAGAVLLAVGAFIPLQALTNELPTKGNPGAEVAMRMSLAPFVPTNAQDVSRLLEAGTPALLAILAMMLLSLALLVSTVRRPSGSLTAAVVLALVVAAQSMVVCAAEIWGVDGTDLAVGIFAALAAALGIAAVIATAIASGRREEFWLMSGSARERSE
ncbi:hypothetical protein JOF56_010969 [Kibdelosporangium banguiense]|uniref:Uncharacterized protein n=1 Tax=Kibdelosporangium banguiense TaxID=1365924 RepID=A0ABS4U1Q9_9PSEU|nr:hypothetical protein [Kibdelosporangium banguiense]MBP2330584.1 hypothetical protein [Kibdelosporangium banguiense]